jgi:hypothetical protein
MSTPRPQPAQPKVRASSAAAAGSAEERGVLRRESTRLYDRRQKKVTRNIVERISV